MFSWNDILDILFGKPDHPNIPNIRDSKDDNLPFDGLTRGTVVIGNPGTGKTRWLANQAVRYCLENPDYPFISLDKSGSFTNDFISIVANKPLEVQSEIFSRVIYDELGNDEWVIPFPQFPINEGNYEEKVQQAIDIFVRLYPDLVDAPILGEMSVKGVGEQFFRLLTAVRNIHGECWQLTEAVRLITNPKELRTAVEGLSNEYQDVKDFFLNEYLNKAVKPGERELRTYTLRMVLKDLDTRFVKARLGYYKAGYTIREVLSEGKILLVNGGKLNNQDDTQHFLFTQLFLSILAEINKRQPHNPKDKPILWLMDEVYTFIEIPGMAKEIAKISPLYRSRKVEPIIVAQGLWQFAEVLRKAIWSFGNWICFGMDNFDEAYEVSQQKFFYSPTEIKLPPKSDYQQPIIEPDRGQYLTAANWIQKFKHRECVMSLYETEQKKEDYVRHIKKTSDVTIDKISAPLEVIKESLIRVRAIPIRDAIEVILQRKLPVREKEPPKVL